MPIKIEELLQLVKAGYTRQEIDAMLAPTQGTAPATATATAPATAPATATATAPATATATAQAQETDPFEKLAQAIVKNLQAGNRGVNQGENPKQDNWIDKLNAIL